MAVSEDTAVVTTVAVAVVTKANTRAKRMKILRIMSPRPLLLLCQEARLLPVMKITRPGGAVREPTTRPVVVPPSKPYSWVSFNQLCKRGRFAPPR